MSSEWCPFSAKAAPHFNALPRAYPPIRVAAIDSSKHRSVNTYFGILSVPSVVLFHNGKIIAKFNDTSFTLNKFAEFVEYFTGSIVIWIWHAHVLKFVIRSHFNTILHNPKNFY
jgi:thiol-disulfide isomerase/thioredoxin